MHFNYIDLIEVIHSIIDNTVNLISRPIKLDNIINYNTLIANQLKGKIIIEIIIYDPPCYLSEEFIIQLKTKFDSNIYIAFREEGNYNTIATDIIIYHINMHNIRNIINLAGNKLIVFFGFNEDEMKKGLGLFKGMMILYLAAIILIRAYCLSLGDEEEIINIMDCYSKASINFNSK